MDIYPLNISGVNGFSVSFQNETVNPVFVQDVNMSGILIPDFRENPQQQYGYRCMGLDVPLKNGEYVFRMAEANQWENTLSGLTLSTGFKPSSSVYSFLTNSPNLVMSREADTVTPFTNDVHPTALYNNLDMVVIVDNNTITVKGNTKLSSRDYVKTIPPGMTHVTFFVIVTDPSATVRLSIGKTKEDAPVIKPPVETPSEDTLQNFLLKEYFNSGTISGYILVGNKHISIPSIPDVPPQIGCIPTSFIPTKYNSSLLPPAENSVGYLVSATVEVNGKKSPIFSMVPAYSLEDSDIPTRIFSVLYSALMYGYLINPQAVRDTWTTTTHLRADPEEMKIEIVGLSDDIKSEYEESFIYQQIVGGGDFNYKKKSTSVKIGRPTPEHRQQGYDLFWGGGTLIHLDLIDVLNEGEVIEIMSCLSLEEDNTTPMECIPTSHTFEQFSNNGDGGYTVVLVDMTVNGETMAGMMMLSGGDYVPAESIFTMLYSSGYELTSAVDGDASEQYQRLVEWLMTSTNYKGYTNGGLPLSGLTASGDNYVPDEGDVDVGVNMTPVQSELVLSKGVEAERIFDKYLMLEEVPPDLLAKKVHLIDIINSGQNISIMSCGKAEEYEIVCEPTHVNIGSESNALNDSYVLTTDVTVNGNTLPLIKLVPGNATINPDTILDDMINESEALSKSLNINNDYKLLREYRETHTAVGTGITGLGIDGANYNFQYKGNWLPLSNLSISDEGGTMTFTKGDNANSLLNTASTQGAAIGDYTRKQFTTAYNNGEDIPVISCASTTPPRLIYKEQNVYKAKYSNCVYNDRQSSDTLIISPIKEGQVLRISINGVQTYPSTKFTKIELIPVKSDHDNIDLGSLSWASGTLALTTPNGTVYQGGFQDTYMDILIKDNIVKVSFDSVQNIPPYSVSAPNPIKYATVNAAMFHGICFEDIEEVVEEVEVSEFDHAVIRYKWGDASGSDLDIRVSVIEPSRNIEVGWDRSNTDTTYLTWNSDNTNDGVEAVLLNIKHLIRDYPDLPEIKILISAFWYASKRTGEVTVSLDTYLGGSMNTGQYDWINSGGTAVDSTSIKTVCDLENTPGNPGTPIALLTYNTLENKGYLQKVDESFFPPPPIPSTPEGRGLFEFSVTSADGSLRPKIRIETYATTNDVNVYKNGRLITQLASNFNGARDFELPESTQLTDVYSLHVSGRKVSINVYENAAASHQVDITSFPNFVDRVGLRVRSCGLTVPESIPSSFNSLSFMFEGCTSFNQDISMWDTSNILALEYMFEGCTSFNQSLNGWNLSNAGTIRNAFRHATSFNSDISQWDVSNMETIDGVFEGATSFNQDISGWNTKTALRMSRMFYGASSFNQDLSQWCVPNVYEYSEFADGSLMTPDDYPSWGKCPRGEDGSVPWPPEGSNEILRFTVGGGESFTMSISGVSRGYELSVVGGGVIKQSTDAVHTDFTIPANDNLVTYELRVRAEYVTFNGGWGFRGSLQVETFSEYVMNYTFKKINGYFTVPEYLPTYTRDCSNMFRDCEWFNQDISMWDTSKVTDMQGMFANCSNFNQDLSQWCVPNLTEKPANFDNSTYSWTLPKPIWGTCPSR